MNDLEEKPYRYPWERALLVVVLYGSLLIFLWYFPTEGGRAFFQILFRGVFYALAGVLLLAITFVFFLFFPLPPASEEKSELTPVEEEDFWTGVVSAQAVMVPAFRKANVESQVWDVLHKIENNLEVTSLIVADPDSGIIAVVEEDSEETAFVLHEISERLRQMGITVRVPH